MRTRLSTRKKCPGCHRSIYPGMDRCHRCGWTPWYRRPVLVIALVLLVGVLINFVAVYVFHIDLHWPEWSW